MTIFLSLSIALFAGLMLSRVFKKIGLNFPDVTCYLIAGVLIGPYGLGRIGIEGIGFPDYGTLENVNIISTTALGFIAFSIGSEFRLEDLRHTGRAATVIGIFQGVAACVLVDVALIALHFILGPDVLTLPAAITLAAIATATAPAATLMVVRQYKADGPLTRLLLPIVALDDAVGLVIFSVSFGVAQALQGGQIDIITVVVNPLLEIVFSILLGSLLGAVFSKIETLFLSNKNRLTMTISFVFLTIALSYLEIPVGPVTISFSSLLVCMMLGAIFCNLNTYSKDIMGRAEKWTAPLNAAFFVLSGAELELGVFSHWNFVLIGVVYILFRSLGKYIGASISSTAMGCDHNIRKYLGITLLPQAGVALGMSSQALALGQIDGSVVRNVTLFGVLIYELFGPLMTRRALEAAGEIHEIPHEKRTRERFADPARLLHIDSIRYSPSKDPGKHLPHLP